MTLPKWFRRWRYRKLIKQIRKRPGSAFICNLLKFKFPYLHIFNYPELWDRREYTQLYFLGCKGPWFLKNADRIKYIQEAIELTKK